MCGEKFHRPAIAARHRADAQLEAAVRTRRNAGREVRLRAGVERQIEQHRSGLDFGAPVFDLAVVVARLGGASARTGIGGSELDAARDQLRLGDHEGIRARRDGNVGHGATGNGALRLCRERNREGTSRAARRGIAAGAHGEGGTSNHDAAGNYGGNSEHGESPWSDLVMWRSRSEAPFAVPAPTSPTTGNSFRVLNLRGITVARRLPWLDRFVTAA